MFSHDYSLSSNYLKENRMLQVDMSIKNVDDVICKNIEYLSHVDPELLTQNILAQLRNLVEYIAIKEHYNGEDVNPNFPYDLRKNIVNKIRSNSELQFLCKFHEMLQKSVSHFTADKDGSELLMRKYYEYLLEIKTYLQNKYGMTILHNINKFPLNTNKELSVYYEKIAERIDIPGGCYLIPGNERYYVQKIKPFFVRNKVYYEVTFFNVNSNGSKCEHLIAFTSCKIFDNYAVKFRIRTDSVSILNKDMPILVIEDYEVSIRPCEWENFLMLFGASLKYSVYSNECRELMAFISKFRMSLTELVCSDDQFYAEIKRQITANCTSTVILNLLDHCRAIIINNLAGANILRYLLHTMNNNVIKSQYSHKKCHLLSFLNLQYGCIPFDQMPYCSSPLDHNPKLYDLLESIPEFNREHEMLARLIKNNAEIEGQLFTPREEIKGFNDIDTLINKYNQMVYKDHTNRKILEDHGNIYIKGYVDDCSAIIKKLLDLSSSGVPQYTESANSWISQNSNLLDDSNKQNALRLMFAKSRVALIYGAAGTGKSTLIRHTAKFWEDNDKIFLANAHSAVNNLRRNVDADKSSFNTISSFLSKKNSKTSCHVLFIDECSTVSNDDMKNIIEKADFKLLVLVGDIYQIESIKFGNWFSIAKRFVPKYSIFDLDTLFRTTNKQLKILWNSVRELNSSICELLVSGNYVASLDDSIFKHSEEDEIILCLNYDGLYGINNINRLLQSNNQNQAVVWGLNTYKVGDPVLFNESNIFSPLIYNNLKGKILAIRPESEEIWFDIEVEKSINEKDALQYTFKLIGTLENGNSIISFSVNKYRGLDEDDNSNNSTVVPFNVAYALSIHKAQGLEYDSVKIVITNDSKDLITHKIFYTAITRAKKCLKIYWSPETGNAVLNSFKRKSMDRDTSIFANLTGIKMKSRR